MKEIKENYNLKIILNNKPIILLSIKGDEDLVKKLKERMKGTWGVLNTIDEELRKYIEKVIPASQYLEKKLKKGRQKLKK